eukprot:g11355.t1
MPELPECKQQLVVRTGFLEEGIQPDVWLMNLVLETCKECQALHPVFEIYQQFGTLHPSEETFECLVSACVIAPGRHWWKAIGFMKQSQQKWRPWKSLQSLGSRSTHRCGLVATHLRHVCQLLCQRDGQAGQTQ